LILKPLILKHLGRNILTDNVLIPLKLLTIKLTSLALHINKLTLHRNLIIFRKSIELPNQTVRNLNIGLILYLPVISLSLMAILFQFGVGLLDYFGQFQVYFALGLFAGVDGVVLQVYVLEQFDRVKMLDLLFVADGVALKVD
jgi:hypothetical protein